MWVTRVSIARPVFAVMVMFALCVLGIFSYVKLGATSSMRSTLAAPVGKKVFFAGEATHRRYPGTVHGAYLSGLQAAKDVIAVRRQRP